DPRPGVTDIAFAGAGWVTTVHALAADHAPDVRITKVASRTPEAARARADQAGATAVDYTDLPGGADIVWVATPPALHRREAERAVAGGALAAVEAPLAATLDDADALVELAGHGQVAYAENLALSPAVAEAVDACRRIGTLTHLEVRFAQGRPPGGPDRTAPARAGGAAFDLGVHALAIAVLMAAPPGARARSRTWRCGSGRGARPAGPTARRPPGAAGRRSTSASTPWPSPCSWRRRPGWSPSRPTSARPTTSRSTTTRR